MLAARVGQRPWLNPRQVTGSLEGNPDVDVASLLSSGGDFIGPGSRPADRSFSFTRGPTLVIPYSTPCPWFQMPGNAMVAIARAARIITRRD